MRSLFLSALVVSLASGPSVAADPPAEAGAPRLVPGSFQAWMVTGPHAGRFYSPVGEHDLNPVLLIFARQIDPGDQPLTQLIKKTDDLIDKHADARLGCCVVNLNDGGFRDAIDKGGDDFSAKLAAALKAKAELETKLKDLAKALELKHATVCLVGAAGPKEYNLAPDNQVSVLLYYKQAIVGQHAVKDKLSEADADKIFADVLKLATDVESRSRQRVK